MREREREQAGEFLDDSVYCTTHGVTILISRRVGTSVFSLRIQPAIRANDKLRAYSWTWGWWPDRGSCRRLNSWERNLPSVYSALRGSRRPSRSDEKACPRNLCSCLWWEPPLAANQRTLFQSWKYNTSECPVNNNAIVRVAVIVSAKIIHFATFWLHISR